MKRFVFWLVILVILPNTALAGGWTTADRSVVAMGTGGAGAARANDPASNAYNPAAGAMSPGLSLSAGFVLAAPNLSAESDSFERVAGDGSPTVPPFLHARFSGRNLSFGASMFVPFGSRVSWPKNWPGRFELVEAKLQVIRAAALVGYRVGWSNDYEDEYGPSSTGLLGKFDTNKTGWAIAVGPFFDFASLELTKALDFIEEEGSTKIDTRAKGVGLLAGLFIRPIRAIDVGLSYQSRSKLSFSGYADFSVPPEFSERAGDQKISSTLTMPDRFRVGALIRPGGKVEVLTDIEVVLWNTVDELRLDFASDETPDSIKPRDWNPTVTMRFGASWRALNYLVLRGGLFVDPTPVPPSTVGPSSPDSHRLGGSIGVRIFMWTRGSVDLAYQLIGLVGAESPQTPEETLPGVTYAGTVHLVGASLTARLF